MAASTRAAAAFALLVALGSCGRGSGTGTSGSSECGRPSADLSIIAKNISFGLGCLTAPAQTPVVVLFENHDAGIGHNLSIFDRDPSEGPGARRLFTGDVIVGPANRAYHVPPLPPGTYYFRCDVHPTEMSGTFVVQG